MVKNLPKPRTSCRSTEVWGFLAKIGHFGRFWSLPQTINTQKFCALRVWGRDQNRSKLTLFWIIFDQTRLLG